MGYRFLSKNGVHTLLRPITTFTCYSLFTGWSSHITVCVSHIIITIHHSQSTPSPLLYNIRVMVIVWRLRGNIIRTALCWIVWHNVHSQQHTYMSSSYRYNRLSLSHWDLYSYTMCRGGCLELYYCNMVEWFWRVQTWSRRLTGSFSALTLFVWSSGLWKSSRNDL